GADFAKLRIVLRAARAGVAGRDVVAGAEGVASQPKGSDEGTSARRRVLCAGRTLPAQSNGESVVSSLGAAIPALGAAAQLAASAWPGAFLLPAVLAHLPGSID